MGAGCGGMAPPIGRGWAVNAEGWEGRGRGHATWQRGEGAMEVQLVHSCNVERAEGLVRATICQDRRRSL